MKDEPALKPLQGNPTVFLARESRYPLYLRQQIRVPLTYLLLREGSARGVCGNLAYLFIRILGISFLLEMIRVE